ncbi:MAG: hypothetical protein L6R40_003089 [Gallowayella cf. fulva]|nr:MAG: hypothetical protein L6R40_003089 [Xanthomendoza cf. fulva]
MVSSFPDPVLLTLFCITLPAVLFLARYLVGTRRANQPCACKQLGATSQPGLGNWPSKFVDKFRRQPQPQQREQGPIVGFVNNLYIHPIKSCRAVQVKEAEVLSTGLQYDRQFTFAELQDPEGKANSNPLGLTGWHFVTQRKYGKLANIHVEIWVPDPKSCNYTQDQANVQSAGVLIVRYPDHRGGAGKHSFRTFEIPYSPTEDQIVERGYRLERLTIWNECIDALLMASTTHADPPEWIKDIQAYLGCSKPFALFRVATGHNRKVFRNAPRKEQLGYQSVVGFVDAYPLHILGLSSVADLDHKLTKVDPGFTDSTALRFRANIYFRGPEAYAEDSWKRIRIGQSSYFVACRTTRCELPNTDQWTGRKHVSQPSKLIRSYRDIDAGAGPGMACMGMQMVPAAEHGIIKVGDEVEVLETGSHHYILQ